MGRAYFTDAEAVTAYEKAGTVKGASRQLNSDFYTVERALKRAGHPYRKTNGGPQPKALLPEYFQPGSRRVEPDPNSGCWLWNIGHHERGYGSCTKGHRGRQYAHRASFDAQVRTLRPDEIVCHRYDTPACVNPAHLFVGDDAANLHDMAVKGRSVWGERHRSAKLTNDQADELRRRAGAGENYEALAEVYGLTPHNVSRIVRNLSYRPLTARELRS